MAIVDGEINTLEQLCYMLFNIAEYVCNQWTIPWNQLGGLALL